VILCTTAPAAPQAQPNRNILSKEPFTLDMDGVKAWFAEQTGKPGTPMTPKEMQSADEKSLVAGGWVLV